MTDPVDPIRGVDRTRSAGRRASDQEQAESDADASLPVPVGQARAHAPPEPPPADSAFAAQLMSGPPRRGLKGGPETLDKARATYLGAEYSGDADRRPKKGLIKKTDI
jgi:hypothetical protein